MDLCVGTPVYELKRHCAGYAEEEKMNTYTDEKVRLWTCRTMEMLTDKSLTVNLNESMKMNR